MGCTSSTPLKDGPPTRQVVVPANVKRDADVPPAMVSQEAFFWSFLGAIGRMLYQPTLWCLYFGEIRSIKIYFVDDGSSNSSPQALVVFGKEDGSWVSSAELANSVPNLPSVISNAGMVNHVTEAWAKLCASHGVLSVDRSPRVVVTYLPFAVGQPGDTGVVKNVFAAFTPTAARAGMPAVTAAAGMAEWLRLLQTPGQPLEAEAAYLEKFKDQKGEGDPIAALNMDFNTINTAGDQRLTDIALILRLDPVSEFLQSFKAILPGLVHSVWERWAEYMPNSTSVWLYGVFIDRRSFMSVSIPGDGDPPKVKGHDALGSAIDPLVDLCREGPPGVGAPSRYILKYSPKTATRAERIELDLTWLPRHSAAEAFDKTCNEMFKWIEVLLNDGEEAARYFVHSTPDVRSRVGDLTLIGDPSAPETFDLTTTDVFQAHIAATPPDQLQPSPQAVKMAIPQQIDSGIPAAPSSFGNQARQADFMSVLIGTIPGLLYEPSLWTRSNLGLNLAIVYLVDDGSSADSPQVLVVFRQTNGTFLTPAELAKSQPLPAEISNERLVSRTKAAWTGLCASGGVIGVDRPARVVLMYSPNVQAPDNNVTTVVGRTPARAGMPALSAAAGMAEFLSLLQAPGQGLEVAWKWLSKFHDTPGDFQRFSSTLRCVLLT